MKRRWRQYTRLIAFVSLRFCTTLSLTPTAYSHPHSFQNTPRSLIEQLPLASKDEAHWCICIPRRRTPRRSRLANPPRQLKGERPRAEA